MAEIEPIPQPHGGSLTPFQPGQSGNPAGKPKGTKHLSTHIQDLLNDEEFDTWLQHPKEGFVQFKGAPIKAIVMTAVRKATAGDDKAREWLAKYGYGQKLQLSNDPDNPVSTNVPVTPELMQDWQEFLAQKSKDATT